MRRPLLQRVRPLLGKRNGHGIFGSWEFNPYVHEMLMMLLLLMMMMTTTIIVVFFFCLMSERLCVFFVFNVMLI
jgi:hypothetical protein